MGPASSQSKAKIKPSTLAKNRQTIRALDNGDEGTKREARIIEQAKPYFYKLVLDNPFPGVKGSTNAIRVASIEALAVAKQQSDETLDMSQYRPLEDSIMTVRKHWRCLIIQTVDNSLT